MSKSQFLVVCCLVLAGSFAGGFVVAHAQDIVPGPNNVRANSFALVDSHGQVQATLQSGLTGAEFVLSGSPGRGGFAPRVEVSGNDGIVVRGQGGAVLWRSPKSGFVPLEGYPN